MVKGKFKILEKEGIKFKSTTLRIGINSVNTKLSTRIDLVKTITLKHKKKAREFFIK